MPVQRNNPEIKVSSNGSQHERSFFKKQASRILELNSRVLEDVAEVCEKTKDTAYTTTVSTTLWGVNKLLNASKQLEDISGARFEVNKDDDERNLTINLNVIEHASEAVAKIKLVTYTTTISTSLWGVKQLLNASKQLEQLSGARNTSTRHEDKTSILRLLAELYEYAKYTAYTNAVSTSLWSVNKLLEVSRGLENVLKVRRNEENMNEIKHFLDDTSRALERVSEVYEDSKDTAYKATIQASLWGVARLLDISKAIEKQIGANSRDRRTDKEQHQQNGRRTPDPASNNGFLEATQPAAGSSSASSDRDNDETGEAMNGSGVVSVSVPQFPEYPYASTATITLHVTKKPVRRKSVGSPYGVGTEKKRS